MLKDQGRIEGRVEIIISKMKRRKNSKKKKKYVYMSFVENKKSINKRKKIIKTYILVLWEGKGGKGERGRVKEMIEEEKDEEKNRRRE